MTGGGWTIPKSSACGFTGDKDSYPEPVIWLAPGCSTLAKTFGDVDCSGSITNSDATKVNLYDALLPYSQTGTCPDIGPSILIGGASRKWGDVDCSGTVNPTDALKISQYVGGQNPSQTEPCPDIGTSVSIDVVGSL
jgi:hypothetical protein